MTNNEVLQKKLPSPVGLNTINGLKTRHSESCFNCGILFRTKNDVELHIISESLALTTNHDFSNEDPCTSYQTSTFRLPLFESLVIEQKEEFVCEQCRLEFKSYKGMKQHIGKMHLTKYKHAKCHLCSKCFRHKYAVKFHIKQVHEKSTRASCKKCGKEFYNKYLLNNHFKTCCYF